jgi:Flp pilus assembly protein TadD
MAAQARIFVGDPRPALDLEREAMRVSPRDTRMHNFHAVMALAHMQLGEFKEALAEGETSIQLSPQHAPAYSLIAAAAAQLGDLDKAHSALTEFRQRLPAYGTIAKIRKDEHSTRAAYLAQREQFYDGLRKAGLPD